MELKTEGEQLAQRAQEISDGKVGKDTSKKIEQAVEKESPLDEVRRLNSETKALVDTMSKLKTDIESLAAYTALSGKSAAGKPMQPTEQELLKQEVDKMAAALVGVYKK